MTRMRMVLGLIASFAFIQMACGLHVCDDIPKVKTGTYVLAAEGSVFVDYEWLVGSEIMVDRESGTATIRYERDGTIYDVQFELVE